MSYVKLINAQCIYAIFILLLLFHFICQSVNIYCYETEQNRKEETERRKEWKKENEGGITPKLILLSIGTSCGRLCFIQRIVNFYSMMHALMSILSKYFSFDFRISFVIRKKFTGGCLIFCFVIMAFAMTFGT